MPLPWPIPVPFPIPVPGPRTEVFVSPDGSRAVWVQGEERSAWLYDRRSEPRLEPVWLDWGVVDVKFTMFLDEVFAIETIRDDGESALFTGDGVPLPDDLDLPGEDAPEAPPEPEAPSQVPQQLPSGLLNRPAWD